MKRLIWLPVAGFLLVAGAAVAVAAPQIQTTASSIFDASTPTTSPDATPAPTDEPDGDESAGGKSNGGMHGFPHAVDGMLDEVLADLVSQGVITQAQADAIVAALEDAAEQQRADIEAEMDEMMRSMEQIQGFLEDGVITQAEVDQLPADSALRELFNSIAQDGEINLEELSELGPDLLRGLPGLPGFGPEVHEFRGPGDSQGGPGFSFEMPDWLTPDTGSDSDSNSDSGTGSDSNS